MIKRLPQPVAVVSLIIVVVLTVFSTVHAGPITNPGSNVPFAKVSAYEGVVTISPGNGDFMELGNTGSDIASTGDFFFRPGASAAVSAMYARNGGQALYLDQKLQIGGTQGAATGNTSAIVYNNSSDYAVYAEQKGAGLAGYFGGRVSVTGSLAVDQTNCSAATGKLYTNNAGQVLCGADQLGNVAGINGITPYVAKFATATTLDSSVMYQKINANGELGVNNASPLTRLDINGTLRVQSLTGCGSGKRLGFDPISAYPNEVICLPTHQAFGGNDNYLVEISAAGKLINSPVYDTGSRIGIGTTTPATPLEVIDPATPSSHIIEADATPGVNNNSLGGYVGGNSLVPAVGVGGNAVYGEINAPFATCTSAKPCAGVAGKTVAGGYLNNYWAGYFNGMMPSRAQTGSYFKGSLGLQTKDVQEVGVGPVALRIGDQTTGFGPGNTVEASASPNHVINGIKFGSPANGNAVYGELKAGTTCTGICAAIYGSSSGGLAANGLFAAAFLADVSIDNGSGNAKLCLNGTCITKWPTAGEALLVCKHSAATCDGKYLYTFGTKANQTVNVDPNQSGVQLWYLKTGTGTGGVAPVLAFDWKYDNQAIPALDYELRNKP